MIYLRVGSTLMVGFHCVRRGLSLFFGKRKKKFPMDDEMDVSQGNATPVEKKRRVLQEQGT